LNVFANTGTDCDAYQVMITPLNGGTLTTSLFTIPAGSNTPLNINWNAGINLISATEFCFQVMIMDECGQTECIDTVCYRFEPCKIICEVEASIKPKPCKKFHGKVIIPFTLNYNITQIGNVSCLSGYKILSITPTFGTVTPSGFSLSSMTGSINGFWNTNMSSLAAGTQCFTIVWQNKCDGSTCETKVCFDYKKCPGIIWWHDLQVISKECTKKNEMSISFLVTKYDSNSTSCENFEYIILPSKGMFSEIEITPVRDNTFEYHAIWTVDKSFVDKNYYFELIERNACTGEVDSNMAYAFEPIIDCDHITATDEEQVTKAYSIYPNPSSDKVNINFHQSDYYMINVMDARGVIVQQFELDGLKNQTYLFDLNNLSKGSYIIQIIGTQSQHSEIIQLIDK
jgi:hypothetical protein